MEEGRAVIDEHKSDGEWLTEVDARMEAERIRRGMTPEEWDQYIASLVRERAAAGD